MKNVISKDQIVAAVLRGRNEVIISSDEVRAILPHKGDKVFVDSLVINAQTVTGQFLMTHAACAGHEVLEGKTIFRGSDYLDMAAQVLGIFARQVGNLKITKGSVLREYGPSKFFKPTTPGELLLMEIKIDDIKVEALMRGEKVCTVYFTGNNFTARVGNEKKATVESVSAVAM